MKPFLKAVAEDIYQRFGNNLSRTAVIFPGKRAGLFFNQYLVECAGHPIWAPPYITISELFDKLSPLKVEAPIRQVCLLHEIFNRLTHRAGCPVLVGKAQAGSEPGAVLPKSL